MRIPSSLLSIVLGVFAGAAFAQSPPDCHGPDLIERALAKQPSADAYNALGAWFAQHNQITCAIPAFRSAIRLQPNAWDIRFNLALALLDARDFNHAISELGQANRLNPDSAVVHTALGIALQQKGQLPAAETELKAAVGLDPHSVPALDHLASVLVAQKRFAAAIRYLNQAIEIDRRDPKLRIALAAAYSENGSNKQAIDVLVDLIKDEPRSAIAHFDLATLYAQEKLFRLSADEYRETLFVLGAEPADPPTILDTIAQRQRLAKPK